MKRSLLGLLLVPIVIASASAQVGDSTHIAIARSAIDTGIVLQGEYAFGRMSHVDLTGSYANDNRFEIHAGWRGSQSIEALDIPGLRLTTLFYGTTSSSAEGTTLSVENDRFGIRTLSGYGWASQAGMLLPYTSTAMVWTKLDVDESKSGDVDRSILIDFDDARRFGSLFEVGLQMVPSKGIALNVGVERTMVFPRHLVFKEMISSIIQNGVAESIGMMSAMMIKDRALSPIVSWVMTSLIRIGISELRREQMNWPFESAPPLLFDSFEIGLMVTL